MVIEWKSEWNKTFPTVPIHSDGHVKRRVCMYYQAGASPQTISNLFKRRISETGIRNMLKKQGVYGRKKRCMR